MESKEMKSPIELSNNTNKKINKESKIVLIVVIVVAILIIGLIVGIVIAKNNNGSNGNTNNGSISYEDDDEEEEPIDLETAPIDERTYDDKLNFERTKLEDRYDIDAVIALYQKYIDTFQGKDENKDIILGLYNERIDSVMELDNNNKYGDQVIADAIAMDNILQTFTSAANVYNSASSYNRTDIMDQYEQIMRDRMNNDDNNILLIDVDELEDEDEDNSAVNDFVTN